MPTTPSSVGRLAAAILLLLSAGPVLAADVKVDWDREVDHARYRTFALREGTPLTNPLADLRIQQAVAGMLGEKGLAEAESGADLMVAVHASCQAGHPMDLQGYAPRGGTWDTAAPDRTVLEEGMLVVDLLDATSSALVWRGIATGTVTNNPSRNRKPVEKVLSRMFRRYPPLPEAPESR